MSLHYVENGRKGGIARSLKYKQIILDVIRMFYNEPSLTKADIARKNNISASFVSYHTKGLTRTTEKPPKDFWKRQEKILLKNFLDKNLPINNQEVKKAIHKI